MIFSLPRSQSLAVLLWVATCFPAFLVPLASAGELPAPEGEVILVVKGAISHTNAPGEARFDYAMLTALGLVTEQIDTEWTPAGAVFEGIRARKLVEAVGATGRRVRVTALNDYSVSVPFEDLADFDTLLATSRDGQRLRLRNQGPVWLMYVPHDRPDELPTVLNHRMVWQLQTLEFE